jgi:tRNA isopentenyl-2-thiomethyl-A-37 hydroxylase MiaE
MFEDGTKVVCHPLASVMSDMKPLSKVALSEEMTLEREACDRAFALACQYSRGRDLVEEMVASNC